MNEYDSLPNSTDAALVVVAERLQRHRAELAALSSDVYGNGKPGMKQMVHDHNQWIARQDERERERRRDRRALFVTVAGGAILQLVLWLVVLARLGVQHVSHP